jgi:hypothetical protein
MLHIAYAPEDAALANRLKVDLENAGHKVNGELPRESGHLLVAVLSPTAWSNTAVQGAVIRALDSSQHIVPVLTGNATLPKLIEHLTPVNFSNGEDFARLYEEVDRLTAHGAPLPMRVLTPTVRRANRRIGFWLAAMVIFWFIVGVILVGVYKIQAPAAEYDNIATEVQATIDAYVEHNLPRSTEDAANFPLTLQAAPTAQRPLLIATTTAMAGGSAATPTP